MVGTVVIQKETSGKTRSLIHYLIVVYRFKTDVERSTKVFCTYQVYYVPPGKPISHQQKRVSRRRHRTMLRTATSVRSKYVHTSTLSKSNLLHVYRNISSRVGNNGQM